MAAQKIYIESQRYGYRWIYILLLIFDIYLWINLFFKLQKYSFNSLYIGHIILSLIFLILPLFFYLSRLDTKISQNGISLRFFPFHLEYKFYALENVEKCYIRTYKPFKEFGICGICGIIKNHRETKGIAYNIFGRKGLQLVLSNGEKILIGTQNFRELKRFIYKNKLEKK